MDSRESTDGIGGEAGLRKARWDKSDPPSAETQQCRPIQSLKGKSILESLQKSAPQRAIECVIQEGVIGHGDPRLLQVVLENLLGNAWKFTSKKPQARIELGTARQNGSTVYFVCNDGSGFDMTYADKLFGTFQRLHAATDFPGSGVGLAIVQRIIHRHGGRTWAEGAEGKGATFSVTL